MILELGYVISQRVTKYFASSGIKYETNIPVGFDVYNT